MDEGGLEKKGLTRRQFLKNAGKIAAVGTAAHLGILEGSALYGKRKWLLDALAKETEHAGIIQRAKDFLSTNYGVTVTLGESWDPVSFSDELPTAEAIASLRVLIEELGKYPPDFFKRNKLSSIRIGTNIHIGPFFWAKRVAGSFNFNPFSPVLLSFDGDLEYFRMTIHHELHHMLDYRDGGFEDDDKRWIEIHENCACGVYGKEKAESQDIKSFLHGSFATSYGASHPTEDRAEFAAMMMVPFLHFILQERMRDEKEKGGSVLAMKYESIKDAYKRWSGGKMDDSYWNAIIAPLSEKRANDRGGFYYDSEDSYGSYDDTSK